MMFLGTLAAVFTVLLTGSSAKCYDPSPAFPVPQWGHNGAKALTPAFRAIEEKLSKLVEGEKYNTSSFSVEVTSNTETLWSQYHTARVRSATRPGTKHVDGDSQYRIASITKTFTVLAVLYQHEAGNLSLDAPISRYLPEVGGDLPLKDITLRILASQLSGLPREFGQSDLINEVPDPSVIGLPPANKDYVPACDEYYKFVPCNASDLLNSLRRQKPLFAPNQASTYSNVAFELLGLAIERVVGMSCVDYIESAIIEPLGMSMTSFSTPSDTHAVLPVMEEGFNYWDVDAGVQNPTGGIYASSSDMSKYVRYLLTHYNSIATGVNWLMPASWSTSLSSFYGMPFEIFRTDRILPHSRRPVTFVTKSGGLPGYASRIFLMPEYGLGLTLLVGGDPELEREIQEIVTVDLVRAAEEAVWEEMGRVYTASYTSTNASLNSSLAVSASPRKGLTLDSFVSNGTDVLNTLFATLADPEVEAARAPWHAQLIPTLLYADETKQQGEIFRVLVVPERVEGDARPVWDDFCVTDVDTVRYAGKPVNEIVFWHERGSVTLPGWEVEMEVTEGKQRRKGWWCRVREWVSGQIIM